MRATLPALCSILCMALAPRAIGQTLHFEVHGGAAGDFFGQAIAALGDIDGDRVPDFVAGAPQYHPAFLGTGYVRLLSGADGMTLRQLSGAAAGDRFGWAVAGVGDVDHDLVPDFLVASPGSDAAGSEAGRAALLSGLDGMPIFVLHGTSGGDGFGTSVSGAGDANADGWPDFLVGAPQNAARPGYARLFSGRDAALLREWTGAAPGDSFGFALAAAGLVDGDLVGDVIIGAPRHDAAGSNAGGAFVLSATDGSLIHQFLGNEPRAELGNAVAGAGDVDGDGRADLIVGSWQDTYGIPGAGNTRGAVRVHSGADGALLFEYPGFTGDDNIGLSVAGAGDVDGDGAGDFMFAARHDNQGEHTGAVYVHSGSDGRLHQNFYGELEPDDLGRGLAAGDLNGDGQGDLVVGSSEKDHFMPREGYVRAYLGCAAGVVLDAPGCAGSGGFTPRLRLVGCPGSSSMTLELDRGLGGAQMRLFVGQEQLHQENVTAECFVLAPSPPVRIVALSGSLPGAGTASIPWDLPADCAPRSRVWLQATIDDPATPSGYASSNSIVIEMP